VADGGFALLYGGEDESQPHRVMVVVHLDDEQNAALATLPVRTTFELSLEEPWRRR
jgi:hypothetical protein